MRKFRRMNEIGAPPSCGRSMMATRSALEASSPRNASPSKGARHIRLSGAAQRGGKMSPQSGALEKVVNFEGAQTPGFSCPGPRRLRFLLPEVGGGAIDWAFTNSLRRSLGLLFAGCHFLMGALASAAPMPDPRKDDESWRRVTIAPSRPSAGIQTGCVMAYGQVLAPPYEVAREGHNLFINRVQVRPSLTRRNRITSKPSPEDIRLANTDTKFRERVWERMRQTTGLLGKPYYRSIVNEVSASMPEIESLAWRDDTWARALTKTDPPSLMKSEPVVAAGFAMAGGV